MMMTIIIPFGWEDTIFHGIDSSLTKSLDLSITVQPVERQLIGWEHGLALNAGTV